MKGFKLGVCVLLFLISTAWLSIVWAQGGASPCIFQLGDVLVTGTQSPLKTSSVSVITAQELKDWGVQTVGEALDFLSGVDVNVGGKGEAHVQVRGLSSNEIKILIDGVPAYETYFRFLDLSQFPVEAIAKIEVIKGLSSVLYGANTLGPVINIVTKKGGEKTLRAASASFGDYHTQNYTLAQGGPLWKLRYWISGGYHQSHGFRLSSDFDPLDPYLGLTSGYHENGGQRDLSYYQKRELNLKLGYEPSPEEAYYLSFDFHHDERGIPPEYDRFWAFTKWDQWHLNLVGQKKLTPYFRVKAQGFYVRHQDTIRDVSWDGYQTAKKWFEESRYNDYILGGYLRSDLFLESFGDLRLGLRYQKDHHVEQDLYDQETYGVLKGWATPGWQPKETFEADLYSVALEHEFPLRRDLALLWGLGYDYFKPLEAGDKPLPKASHSWNPQLALIYSPSSGFTFHASLGKKTRFPSLKELYSDYAGGNPELGPEKNVGYELGFEKKLPRGRIWASYFYQNVTDLIDRLRTDNGWLYVNVGRAVLKGVEIGATERPFSHILFKGSYTYLSARDKAEDRDLARRPRHKVILETKVFLPKRVSLDLLSTYTAYQFDYLRDGSKRKLDDFLLINLNLTKGFSWRPGFSGELFLTVTNLTDRNYDDGHGPMPGRNFLLGLRTQF